MRATVIQEWKTLGRVRWDATEGCSEGEEGTAWEAFEAFQHSEWTVKKIGGIRNLAGTVQRRVSTVTSHMAKHFPNKAIPVFFVTVTRKHLALDECIKRSAHELVSGRRAGSVKCRRCLQVCGRKKLRIWLPVARVPWQAKRAPPGPLPLVVLGQEEAEETDLQNDDWLPAFGPAPAPRSHECA